MIKMKGFYSWEYSLDYRGSINVLYIVYYKPCTSNNQRKPWSNGAI
jgi:hypothetical protein